MRTVRIYSDGACSGNPGVGGWGAVLQCDDPPAEKEISGGVAQTTNNRMELTAVIAAVQLLKETCRLEIFTDSKYVCQAFTEKWLEKWQRNGWRTANKQAVKNVDLWQELIAALTPHTTTWHWVKGHNEHPENERADRLAVAAREQISR